MKLQSFVGACGTIAFSIIIPINPIHADGYEITDIGTLGGSSAVANDINDAAEITGYSWPTGSDQHAFLYDGSMLDLGTSEEWLESQGTGINDKGYVTGFYSKSAGDYICEFAFIYDGNRIIELDIEDLPFYCSYAYAINNSDQVTGQFSYLSIDGYYQLAFLYHNQQLQNLGSLGGRKSLGYGINDAGQVVGYSTIEYPGDVRHAFLYADGVMQDLGTLGGTNSTAHDINNDGLITGTSDVQGDIATHAFLFDGDDMYDLGTLGGNDSIGLSINGEGQVVGTSQVSGDTPIYAAFLYDDESMLDLCELTECIEHGWDSLESATGINDEGEITGVGYIKGSKRAFLITKGEDDDPHDDDIEICDDGIDNDDDGLIDCKDRDCRQDPVCKVTGGGKR